MNIVLCFSCLDRVFLKLRTSDPDAATLSADTFESDRLLAADHDSRATILVFETIPVRARLKRLNGVWRYSATGVVILGGHALRLQHVLDRGMVRIIRVGQRFYLQTLELLWL